MKYEKTKGTEVLCTILVLLWGAFFIVLGATQIQHWDSDIFWALRTGSWIVEHGWVPLTDPLSYTFQGAQWIDFTWGFQVIAHVFYSKLGGWTGLYILQLLLTFAIFGALFFNIRLCTAKKLWLLPLLLMLSLACAYPRLFIRPHLFGFLLISLYLLILNINERRNSFPLLFIILPLQLLWVNIHSSAILGVFIVWAYASGEFIDVFIRVGFKGFAGLVREKKRLLILGLILPFVTLINPYGLKLAIFPFIHQGGVNTDALRHIGEWARLPFKDLFLSLYPLPVNYFTFRLLVYMGLISLFLNRRSLKTRDLMLFFGALYMARSHVRWVGQFAFFAAPVIAFNFTQYLESRGKADLRWLRRGGLALAFIISIFMGLLLMDGTFMSKIGIGLRANEYPSGSVRFLKENELKGNIYNYYDFGGYLSFNYPELKVFIDGRTPTVYSPRFYWKSRHVESKEGWGRVSSEYGITMALVKLTQPLCKVLYEDAEWSPVVFDNLSALYLKKGSGYGDIIEKKGLSFTPCSVDAKYPLPEGKKERLLMKKGLEDVLHSIQDGVDGMIYAYPHRLMGLLLGELEGEDSKSRAVEELQTAAASERDGFIYYDLGLALGRAGRTEEAIKAFKTSLSVNKNFKRSYLALGLTYFDNKNYEKSVSLLGEYVRRADDKAEFSGLKVLGRACFKLGRLECAEDAFKKADFITVNDKKRGEVSYYIGNTLFERGKLEEGVSYYRSALSKDVSYRKVLENLSKMLTEKKELKKAAAITSLLKENEKKD